MRRIAGWCPLSMLLLRGSRFFSEPIRRRSSVWDKQAVLTFRARRADVSRSPRDLYVRQRTKRPYLFACGGSRTGFLTPCMPAPSAVRLSAGDIVVRRRLARTSMTNSYGDAVPYENLRHTLKNDVNVRLPPTTPDRLRGEPEGNSYYSTRRFSLWVTSGRGTRSRRWSIPRW